MLTLLVGNYSRRRFGDREVGICLQAPGSTTMAIVRSGLLVDVTAVSIPNTSQVNLTPYVCPKLAWSDL